MSESRTETFEESLEMYNEAKDVKIVTEENGDLRSAVTTRLAAGDGPEMYRWTQNWTGGHWERDFLYDASDDLKVDPADQFSSPAVEAITVGPDDAVVGLPVASQTVGLLYNEDMVDEPPETFDEMESIMQEHNDPTQGKFGLSHPIDAYFASAWLHAFGGYYLQIDENGEGETGVDLDATKRGMEFLRDRIWPYVALGLDRESQRDVFRNENAPLAINGPWAIGAFEDSGLDVGVAPLPAIDGHAPAPYTGTSMWYFSARMADDAERRDAALEYAEWISTSRERQLAHARAHGSVPVVDSISDDSLGEQVAGFKRSYESGIPIPSHRRMNEVWAPVEDAIYAVLQDSADIDSRFDEAAATIRSNWRQ
ncbi:extracellular solute-binding protein [Natronoarchaeum mannanilyticum]